MKLLGLSIALLALAGCVAVPSSARTEGPPAPIVILTPPPAIPGADPQPATLAAPKGYFAVEIEQGGAKVPIRDHEAVVDRKPFDIVVSFADWPDAVSVNASTSSRLFDAARAGASFELGTSKTDSTGKGPPAPFAMGHGLAEEDMHPAAELYLTDDGAHIWFYESDKSHRCHSVSSEGRSVVCRRHVEQLGRGEPMQHSGVAAFTGAAIYLVLLSLTDGTAAKQWDDRVERQPAYLRIKVR